MRTRDKLIKFFIYAIITVFAFFAIKKCSDNRTSDGDKTEYLAATYFTANPINNIIPDSTYHDYDFGLAEQSQTFPPAPAIYPIGGKIVCVINGASVIKSIGDEIVKFEKSSAIFINTSIAAQTIDHWINANDKVWASAMKYIADKNCKASDVQIIITMQDVNGKYVTDKTFPAKPQYLQAQYQKLFATYKIKFPNLKEIILTSRPYSGYVTNPLQADYKEPDAYFNGWANKWTALQGYPGIHVTDGNYLWTYNTPENYFKKGDIHLTDPGNTFFANQTISYLSKFNWY